VALRKETILFFKRVGKNLKASVLNAR